MISSARLGDKHVCPLAGHGTTAITSASDDTNINFMGAARVGDTCGCGAVITTGFPSIQVNGRPMAHLGSPTSHGGTIITGSGDVGGGFVMGIAPGSAIIDFAVLGVFRPDGSMDEAKMATLLADPALKEKAAAANALVNPDNSDLEEEEEEEELPDGVTLRIGVFFDGTLNNANNTALGILCGASHPILPEDLDASCKPYMTDPESSYAGDETNIKKLSDLYFSPRKIQTEDGQHQIFRSLYVAGIGTKSGFADSGLGAAMGRGETGVIGKVERGFDQIKEVVFQFSQENPGAKITKLVFDTFGFSRGAAASRHFANEVRLGKQGPLGRITKMVRHTFHKAFICEYNLDVQVSFIGLFDTVASVGGLDNFGYVRSQKAPGLKLFLPRDLFPNVIQLSARDEVRGNFPLERVKPQHRDYTLPGVHSDIGGSYFPESEECLLVTPMQALDIPLTTNVNHTSIYRDAQQAKTQWEAKGWPSEMLEVVTPPAIELPDLDKGRPNTHKRAYAALQLKRKVRGELSRVYLRVMYELAKQHGVRFGLFDKQYPSYAIPSELQEICDRFVAGDYSTTPEEEQMLRLKYIHVSAHWNPSKSMQGTTPRTSAKLFYVNAPTTDGIRVQHPHVAD